MKLTVVIFATSTTTLVTLLRNPVASAVTEYCPGMSPIAVNVPAEEVAVCDTTPVDVLVIAILAWLINAWLESVTVPLIPLCICACTGATRRQQSQATQDWKECCLRIDSDAAMGTNPFLVFTLISRSLACVH